MSEPSEREYLEGLRYEDRFPEGVEVKDVEINVVNAYKLDLTKKYVLLFDWKQITKSDAHKLVNKLKEMGIESVAVGVNDVKGVKIIEATPEGDKDNG